MNITVTTASNFCVNRQSLQPHICFSSLIYEFLEVQNFGQNVQLKNENQQATILAILLEVGLDFNCMHSSPGPDVTLKKAW